MFITRSAQDIARDAVQIFGGRGITKTGMGKHIEHVRSRPLSVLVSDADWTLTANSTFISITERLPSTPFWEEVSASGPSFGFSDNH